MSFSLLYSRFAFLLFYVPSNSLSPSLQNLCIVTYLLCSTTLDNILHCILLLLLYSSLLYSTLSSPPSACHCHFPLSLRLSLSLLIYLHIPFSSLLLRSIQQYLILLLSFNLPPSLSLSLFFPSLSFHLFLSLSISPFSTLLSLPHSSPLSPRLRRVQQLFGKESGRLG